MLIQGCSIWITAISLHLTNCPFPPTLVFYKFILLSENFINGNYKNGNCNKESGYGKIK